MNKPFTLTFFMAIVLFCAAVIIQFIRIAKNDTIIKQNDKEIIAKKYKISILPNKNLKSFNCGIDSSYWRYPPNKILYDGILVKAKHSPDEVVMKVIVKNEKYKIIKHQDVTNYFSCYQVDELKPNIGKRMIITKVFFPEEKIFYKFL